MNHTQRAALLAAEEAFRWYSDHHAMKGDETKARASMTLAGQMAAALAEPEPDGDVLSAFAKYALQFTYNSHPARPEHFPKSYPWFEAGYNAGLSTAQSREPLTAQGPSMGTPHDIARCTAMHQGGKPIAPCTTCARHVQAHPIGSNTPWMTIPPAFWNGERYVCSHHLETRHAAP